MKYRVITKELHWYDCVYTVEADSEEEARELIEDGVVDADDSQFDCVDQIDINS